MASSALTGTPTLVAGRVAAPPLPYSMGAGGARAVLRTELFPSLTSSKRAFSGIIGSLILENISESMSPDPKLALYCYEHCSSGKELED